jgi:ethanolamine ammonia-lyase large subunit
MGVPAGDDVMLNYQTTSYHDAAVVRKIFGLHPAPEFEAWLEQHGIMRNQELAFSQENARRGLIEHLEDVLNSEKSAL